MKIRHKISRFIAIVLLVTVSISSIPSATVYAESDTSDLLESVADSIEREAEKSVEASIDDTCVVKAGNWWIARNYDRLSPNFFHNAVQEEWGCPMAVPFCISRMYIHTGINLKLHE